MSDPFQRVDELYELTTAMKEATERTFKALRLLHDADWELEPASHPARVVAWCRERSADDLAHAISAHGISWRVPHVSLLDKALVGADEPTGLVVAVAKVNPRGFHGITSDSVMRKFRTRSFAAGIDRDAVEGGARLLGWTLHQLFDFAIGALAPHAAEVGVRAAEPS